VGACFEGYEHVGYKSAAKQTQLTSIIQWISGRYRRQGNESRRNKQAAGRRGMGCIIKCKNVKVSGKRRELSRMMEERRREGYENDNKGRWKE
jgi:hypothetical protein